MIGKRHLASLSEDSPQLRAAYVPTEHHNGDDDDDDDDVDDDYDDDDNDDDDDEDDDDGVCTDLPSRSKTLKASAKSFSGFNLLLSWIWIERLNKTPC